MRFHEIDEKCKLMNRRYLDDGRVINFFCFLYWKHWRNTFLTPHEVHIRFSISKVFLDHKYPQLVIWESSRLILSLSSWIQLLHNNFIVACSFDHFLGFTLIPYPMLFMR